MSILSLEQVEYIRDNCTADTYGASQSLDSGTFQALAVNNLNLSTATPLPLPIIRRW